MKKSADWTKHISESAGKLLKKSGKSTKQFLISFKRRERMRWFKHDCNASDDIKLVRLEAEFGILGYAVFFKFLEIVGKEGEKGRLLYSKYPKKLLARRVSLEESKVDEILEFMCEIGLCSRKAFKSNALYFPNFRKRSDDYTKRVQRKYEHSQSDVPLEEKRIEVEVEEKRTISTKKKSMDKIVDFYIEQKRWNKSNLSKNDWKRMYIASSSLLNRTSNDIDKSIMAIQWVVNKEYSDWTLETVVRKYPEISKDNKTNEVLKLEEECEKVRPC